MNRQHNLIQGQAKQITVQKALNAFSALSAEDQAGVFEMLKILPYKLDAAGRESIVHPVPNPQKESTDPKLTRDQVRLYKRAAGFFSSLDECKAAGIPGREILGILEKATKDPSYRPC